MSPGIAIEHSSPLQNTSILSYSERDIHWLNVKELAAGL